MAVPGRRNGLMEEEDDYQEDNALFDEYGVDANGDYVVPPHLREFAAAAQSGDVDALRLALENLNGDINEPLEDRDTALHLACLYGYLPCVQLLLERGANLEVQDEDGAIPLHDACAGGFADIVEIIINRANDAESVERMLNTTDVEGDTPLHHAARGEHVNVIRLLLESGASSTKTNGYGKIPSELADPGTEARRVLEAAAGAVVS